MKPPRAQGGAMMPARQRQVLLLLSCLASFYVVGRLWTSGREVQHLLRQVTGLRQQLEAAELRGAAAAAAGSDSPAPEQEAAPLLYFSVRQRPDDFDDPAPLEGPSVDSDAPPSQEGDGSIVGAIDGVEAGRAHGWACLRAPEAGPLKVLLYVDGIRVAEAEASRLTAQAQSIGRLCQRKAAGGGAGGVEVSFSAALPLLALGVHELRAFAVSPEGGYRQELHQSPVAFRESDVAPDQEEALRRKDAIILLRNAQLSALWDELHTRQPWRNAAGSGAALPAFGGAEADSNATRLVAVVAINTGLGARARRDVLRRTWVPRGAGLAAVQAQHGMMVRFVVGRSEQRDDALEKAVEAEAAEFGDILRLDMVDTYADLSLKTMRLFGDLSAVHDAEFYFKVDDDTIVNLAALSDYLQEKAKTAANLYLGCMKSGQVLTDKRWKWYEPEHWRFGDPASSDGRINYPRHASGQVYGLSRAVARYIGQNAAVLHRYANEDVGVGAWLLGLDVNYVDERRLCCDSEAKCAAQSGRSTLCLAYYEHQCAGICHSERRLEPIWDRCIRDPLGPGSAAAEGGAAAAAKKKKHKDKGRRRLAA